MPSKKRTPKQPPTGTPLDTKQRLLLEKQEKLKREIEKVQRTIEDAPARAAEEQKRRREELVSRSMQRTRRLDAPTLLDKRYDAFADAAAALKRRVRRRPLRVHQRQARLIFFGLLAALVFLVTWVLSVWKW